MPVFRQIDPIYYLPQNKWEYHANLLVIGMIFIIFYLEQLTMRKEFPTNTKQVFKYNFGIIYVIENRNNGKIFYSVKNREFGV